MIHDCLNVTHSVVFVCVCTSESQYPVIIRLSLGHQISAFSLEKILLGSVCTINIGCNRISDFPEVINKMSSFSSSLPLFIIFQFIFHLVFFPLHAGFLKLKTEIVLLKTLA